jgi:hypothetical protein
MGLDWMFLADTKAAAQVGGDAVAITEGGASGVKHDPRDSFWPVAVVLAPQSATNTSSAQPIFGNNSTAVMTLQVCTLNIYVSCLAHLISCYYCRLYCVRGPPQSRP